MATDDLIDFVSSVSGDDYLKVEETLGDGFVRLCTAEAERRQAKHDIRHVEDIVIEMLRNARDAGANKIFLATTKGESNRSLSFLDNGCGIPQTMQGHIFEPRVTSKLETMVMDSWGVHGRGMALYSIKENASRAIVVSSEIDLGSAFYVDVDLEALPERHDQSTLPMLVKEEDGTRRIARGPHNIIRTVLEFALEEPDVDVYLGSPSEICATLIHLGQRLLSYEDLFFADDSSKLPLFVRPATCADASELVNMSEKLGLAISERTAHRILAADIKSLRPLISKLVPQDAKDKTRQVDLFKDNRGLKIGKDDLQSFSRSLEGAFMPLGSRYYLSLKDSPTIRVGKDAITVRFEIDKED